MSNSDQRINPRFRCRCYATLANTTETLPGHILNLSESGALIAVIEEHQLQADQKLSVVIEVEDTNNICLEGVVAHTKEHYIGIEYSPLSDDDTLRIQKQLENLSEI